MSQSFLYTWLEWVYSNRLIPSAPPCSVFNDSLVPLNKVHTYDCRLRSSTVWLRPSLLHLYLMLPVYGPHVQKEETFTSHTLSFPASYDCFPTSLDLECAVCAQVGLLFGTPWTVAPQTPLSMEFSRQDYWNGLPFPPPGDLPDPGIKLLSPTLASRFFTAEPSGKPRV